LLIDCSHAFVDSLTNVKTVTKFLHRAIIRKAGNDLFELLLE